MSLENFKFQYFLIKFIMGKGEEKPSRGILDDEVFEAKPLGVTARTLHTARDRGGVLTTQEVQGGINGLLTRAVFAVVKDMGKEGPGFGPNATVDRSRVVEAIAVAGGATNKQLVFLVRNFAEEVMQILERPEVYMAGGSLPAASSKGQEGE